MPDTMEERWKMELKTFDNSVFINEEDNNIEHIDMSPMAFRSFFIQSLDTAYKEGRASMAEEVKNYQYGFIRQGEDGELERAPEWQVIEDLLNVINQLEKE